MKIRALTIAVTLLVAGSTTLALAGDKGGREPLWRKAWERHLKKADTNHDGMLSKEELEAAAAAEKAAHANAPKTPKAAPTTPPTGEGRPHIHVPHVHLLRDFDKIDTNHDGKISAEEFEVAFKAAMEEARRLNEGNGTGRLNPAPKPSNSPAPANTETNK